MPRLFLFDIDGTLIRTGGAGIRAFARTASDLLGRPDATRRLSFAGRTDRSLVRELLRAEGLPDGAADVDRFVETYLAFLSEELRRHAGERCPGVALALERLGAGDGGAVVALLTGNVRQGARLKLSAHSLWEAFAFGAFGDDHEDRDRLAAIACDRATDRMGARPRGAEVLVVGDTPLDVACARAVGADCLAVTTGQHSREELADSGATVVVDSLVEIDWDALRCGAPVQEALR